jgi:hypothetical protein
VTRRTVAGFVASARSEKTNGYPIKAGVMNQVVSLKMQQRLMFIGKSLISIIACNQLSRGTQ